MSAITRFEDAPAWQEARHLTRQVYHLTSSAPFARDVGLRDQLRRAALSGMTLAAEGLDCESEVKAARSLEGAQRSVIGVQSLLYAALDLGYLSTDAFREYYEQAARAKALIGACREPLGEMDE